jgi:hypothetical protein
VGHSIWPVFHLSRNLRIIIMRKNEQIIVKTNEQGKHCLFDTRSDKFFENGCMMDPEGELLEIANSIARRSAKTLYNLVVMWQYGEHGYTEAMLAQAYLKLNPDLEEKALEQIKNKIPTKGKDRFVRGEKKRRGRPKGEDSGPKEPKVPGRRGRPPKTQSEAKSSDGNSSNSPVTKQVAYVDGKPRGRGRPPKGAVITYVTVTI